MLDIKTEVSFKLSHYKWVDFYDSIIGDIVPESEFVLNDKNIENNQENNENWQNESKRNYNWLSVINWSNYQKYKFDFKIEWIVNSILFNKNIDYKDLDINFDNSIFNSYQYEKFFYEEMQFLKENYNKEFLHLFLDNNIKFLRKHNEILYCLKQYGINYNYFSPIMRFFSIYFLIHNLSTDKKEYFMLFINSKSNKVTLSEIINKVRITDLKFLDDFISCLLIVEGKETKVLKYLDQLLDYIELETKIIKLDFETRLISNEFLNYISPKVSLSSTDLKYINNYTVESFTDIRHILDNAIQVVNSENPNHRFNKLLDLYDINKNNNEIASTNLNKTKQESELINIKYQIETLNSNQIARLLVKLLFDLVSENYFFKIRRTHYCKNILQKFNVKEELINKTISAIGKIISKPNLKDNTKITYKIIYNYLEKNNINIMNFCE